MKHEITDNNFRLIREAAVDLLKSQGFTAQLPIANWWEKSSKSECWKIEFQDELPTGQFAFIVKKVQIGLTLWRSEKDIFSLEIQVGYEHHSGGSNGVTRMFLCVPEGLFKVERYTLVDRDLLHKANRYLDEIRKEEES